jgi:hypothetical protein
MGILALQTVIIIRPLHPWISKYATILPPKLVLRHAGLYLGILDRKVGKRRSGEKPVKYA